MNWKRTIFILRLVGYSTGVCGLGTIMAARMNNQQGLFQIGGALLLVMFLSLMGTYIIYMISPFRTKRGLPRDSQ